MKKIFIFDNNNFRKGLKEYLDKKKGYGEGFIFNSILEQEGILSRINLTKILETIINKVKNFLFLSVFPGI